VGAHQLDLRHDADVDAAVEALAELPGRTESGQARAEDQDIVGQDLGHPRVSRES